MKKTPRMEKPRVVITGASKGIGKALTCLLADQGFEIIAVARELAPLKALQKHNPEKITILAADVTLPDDRLKIKDLVDESSKPILLVHNAHAKRPISLLKNVTVEDFRHHMQTNLEAPLFLTQLLLPNLKGGRVLHISSGVAHYPVPGIGTYCIGKAALFMLYRCLPTEMNIDEIAFGSAIPGVVDTDTQRQLREASKEDLPVVDKFIQYKTSGQLIPPETVARFLAYVLLDTSNQEFSESEWVISDRFHHPHWNKDNNVQYSKVNE